MEYQMKKFGLELRFTAESVQKDEIDDATFELPSGYKQVSKKDLDALFIGLQ